MKNKRQIAICTLLIVFLSSIFVSAELHLTAEAQVTESNVSFTISPKEIDFPFDIPTANSPQTFNWTVHLNNASIGQLVILKFSHDNVEWNCLANAYLDANGNAVTNQPVDTSWAVEGKNYLMVDAGGVLSSPNVLIVNSDVVSATPSGTNDIAFWLSIAFFIAAALLLLLLIFKRGQVDLPLKTFTKLKISKNVFSVILIALLLRLAIAPLTEQRFDSYANRLWGSLILGYGKLPFEPSMPIDYPLILRYALPPIWLFALAGLFSAWVGLSGFTFPTAPSALWQYGVASGNMFESYRSFIPAALPSLNLLFKIPGILADVGIGIILYKMTKGTKYEKIVLIAWLFNPFTFMISSIWGALDPVAAFFAVAAVYLVWKNKPVLSAVFLSLGFATKIFPAFLLIPVLIYLTKTKSIKDSFKYLATFLAVAVIVFGLFAALPGGFTFIYNLFFFKSSADISLAQSSGYGVTLAWTSILQLGSLPVFPLIFVPAFVVLCVGFWKFGKQFDSLVVCCACTLLLTYLAYPVVNPQYVFWVFPFLTYLAVKRKFHWILYVGLMAAVFLFVLALYNPVQFISPAFVPNELNFQPWSNLVKSMRLILNNSALAPIAISFAAISLASLAYLTKVPTRVIHRRRENEDITSH